MKAKALCGRVNCPGYGYIGGMIESEMGYRIANLSTTHNLSLFILFINEAAAVKSPL
jgi:hypothetical protein